MPTRIGRFTIIRRLGAGGMGEVFAAFDEQLDRKVAVKVLHRSDDGEGQSARLFREAQAMARLSHPNVVTVHEIGTHAGQTFIAMEFVEGWTLEAWLLAASRDWRAIVAVYVNAGRGLQAAHEAGLIHRDFKPSNVMVGRDGRARVLDFGIAGLGRGPSRPDTPGDALTSSASSLTASALDRRITAEGALLGTPAYMSPEQIVGAHVTAASDQFNFCVALYESLFAFHPFLDEPITWTGLRRQVVRGQLREPPRTHGVPGWLLAVLRRGLSVRPESRFGSMAELLVALEHDPSRRWRRFVAPVAFAAGAVIAGLAARSAAQRDGNACDSGAAIMASLWNAERKAELAAAARATGVAWADTVIGGVTRDLDGYADAWIRAHQDACVAHRDGAQSSTMLDQRMSCLDRRRAALTGALELLARPDPTVLEGAVKVVQQLPRVADCSDLTSLGSDAPPDPAIAAEVEAQRNRLDRASGLAAAGSEADSASIAADVLEQARKLGYRPLEAEARLVQARTMLDFGASPTVALPALNSALVAAIGAGSDAAAGEVLARRAYVLGLRSGRIADARLDAALSREYLARTPANASLLGLLANNLGIVEVAAGDRAAAAAQFDLAVRTFESQPNDSLDLTFALANLGMQTEDAARREELLERMVVLRREMLGGTHPLTAHGEIFWGLYTLDPIRAAERIARGCTALDAHARSDPFDRMQCRDYLGTVRAEVDPASGAEELRKALAIVVPDYDTSPEGRSSRAVQRAYVRLYTGEAGSALAETRRDFQELPEENAEQWWSRLATAESRLALALNLEAARVDTEAVELLDRAIPAFEALGKLRLEVALGQRLAAARTSRARALLRVAAAIEAGVAAGDAAAARSRAAEDIGRADAWYRAAGPGYARRLGELGAVREGLP